MTVDVVDTRLSRVAWWVAVASLLLGPLVALLGIVLGLASRRGHGDWEPPVALGAMVAMGWLALAAAGIGMV